MSESSPSYSPGYGIVNTIHILSSGEVITNVEDYLKVEYRFAWVERKFIVEKILRLRKLTDEGKKSVIVIYEEGRMIKEFVNVDYTFTPLAFF